jgi:hypothetical protein
MQIPTVVAGSVANDCVPQVEGIGIDEESLAYLGEIGERTSLRHSVQVRLAQAEQFHPLVSLLSNCAVGTYRMVCTQHN